MNRETIREPGLSHDVTQSGKREHDPDLENRVRRNPDPHNAEHGHDRKDDRLGNFRHLHPDRYAEPADDQVNDVGDEHRRKQGVHQLAVGLHHERPRGDAVNDEGADQQRRRDIAGDAEGDGRDQVRPGHRAVGGFGRGDALEPARAESFR